MYGFVPKIVGSKRNRHKYIPKLFRKEEKQVDLFKKAANCFDTDFWN